MNRKCIRRGDIYYVGPIKGRVGSEQWGGRPAIVVSNDSNNRFSGTVGMVFLTSKDKKQLPTHVPVTVNGVKSIALCEAVNTISIERLERFRGTCTAEELKKVDDAVAIGLFGHGLHDDREGGN